MFNAAYVHHQLGNLRPKLVREGQLTPRKFAAHLLAHENNTNVEAMPNVPRTCCDVRIHDPELESFLRVLFTEI